MPATTDLAVIITGGLAVFGISWWLGNKFENLGTAAVGAVRDTADVIVNATGETASEVIAGMSGDVEKVKTPQAAFAYFNRLQTDKDLMNPPGSKGITAVPMPVKPPDYYYETREVWDEEEGWTYPYPVITPAYETGMSIGKTWEWGLPSYWDERPRGWDAWGLKLPWQ